MARRRARASMREGPLAELFKATEAAQRQADKERDGESVADAPTAEHAGPEPAQEPAPTHHRGRLTACRTGDCVRSPSRRRRWDARRARAPRMHRAPRPESAAYLAVIRVVGVGGGGLNAVNRMIEAGISQVEFIAVNTDIQQLRSCEAPIKLHIGRELTQGLGSGADPVVGAPGGRGGLRPGEARAPRVGHGLHHRGRGRRHRLGRRARDRADRARARGAHRRDRDDAVRLRGNAPPQPGRGRGRHAPERLRHGHCHPERPAARGARPLDLDARGFPRRRRRPPAGRPGNLRPHHHAGAHQPRLRRRAHGHVGRRHRPHGHRLLDRRGSRPRGGRASASLTS